MRGFLDLYSELFSAANSSLDLPHIVRQIFKPRDEIERLIENISVHRMRLMATADETGALVEAMIMFDDRCFAEQVVIFVKAESALIVEREPEVFSVFQAGDHPVKRISDYRKLIIPVPIIPVQALSLTGDQMLRLGLDLPPVTAGDPPLDACACAAWDVNENATIFMRDHGVAYLSRTASPLCAPTLPFRRLETQFATVVKHHLNRTPSCRTVP